ncbi:MAG TPA: HD domain-containing phosphohydrolase [Candidatus Acidoferrum sp.]
MRLEIQFLHSRLARRTFWLFVLCALVPITALAIFSLFNVTRQLKEQNLRELHQVSREEAINIYGRLSFLEANLKLVALTVRDDPAKLSAKSGGLSVEPNAQLATQFVTIDLVKLDGKREKLFGTNALNVEYTAEEQQALRSGRNVLSTIGCDKLTLCVLVSRVMDLDRPEAGILVGEVRSDYLWDVANLREPLDICVLNPSGQRLFCSGEIPERFPDEVTRRFSGQYEWKSDKREYLASYWNLPLQSFSSSSHWTIVSSEAQPDLLAPLAHFRNSFLLVFLLAFWIVVFLSLVQIRRSLIPLGKLKEGTRGISRGEFQTRVAITSGDEFEELAGSFNSMAGRIERQLKALEMVSDIDRAVLSAWDLPRIVNTVCSRLRDILPHDMVTVSLFEASGEREVVTHVFTPGGNSPELTETICLSSAEMEKLQTNKEVYTFTLNGNKQEYLRPLRERGIKHCLTIPVVTGRGQSAIFTLGHLSTSVWSQEDEERGRHLADQIAVAFSNSQLVTDLEQLQWGTLTALARAIDAKSPWTLGHSERVTASAIKIAKAMGLPPKEITIIRRGGLVHDIGKIGVSAEIIDKPGKLTAEEMTLMREHVNIGVRILRPIPMLGESMSIVAQHHEWVNGEGYPNKLAGDEITLHARIFAVADCFDALISDRPYRAGMPIERVMQILEDGSGKQFDPEVLVVFRAIPNKEEVLTENDDMFGALVGVK